MKQTCVVNAYYDEEDTDSPLPSGPIVLVPEAVSCRLFSVHLRPSAAGAGFPELSFKDGGSSGTSRLSMAFQEDTHIQALAIPTHGIRFDEGIYLDIGGTGTGVGSISITYQGS